MKVEGYVCMKNRLLLMSICILTILLLMVSCGESYDVKEISDISITTEGEDVYNLTCLQVAEMIDKYVFLKSEKCKRGTDAYVEFLNTTALNDEELKSLREWPAIEVYITGYTNPTGSIEDLDLDADKLPPNMTGLTIREFAEYNWGEVL